MRDPNRIDPILDEIREIWKRHPDLRLGQLILNARLGEDHAPRLYNLEDDRLIERLRSIYRWRTATSQDS